MKKKTIKKTWFAPNLKGGSTANASNKAITSSLKRRVPALIDKQ